MNKNDNNTSSEFTAILLILFVPTLILLLPTAILYFATKPATGNFLYPFLFLFILPALVAGITYGMMGLEVNRKVKRIDLLQGGLEFEVVKTYYKEIAKHKKLPVVFILFASSATFLVCEIVWFKVIKGGYLAIILFAILVTSLWALRHYAKKYNLKNNDEKRKD
jgi:hypothetical protein